MKSKQGSPGQLRRSPELPAETGGPRRRTLRKLAAGSVAAGVALAAPGRWTRPVVESVMLPAHAQTSADVPEDGDFFMDLSGFPGPDDFGLRQDRGAAPMWARLLDRVVPTARAGEAPPPRGCLPCGVCARIRGGKVTVTVTGLSDGGSGPFCLEASGRVGGTVPIQLVDGDTGDCEVVNSVEILRVEGSAPTRTLIIGGGTEASLEEDPSRTCSCVEMACIR